MILRCLSSLAAPAGRNGRLSVFYFHRVLERPDPLLGGEPDAAVFDRILGWVGAQFRVLDPMDACERLRSGTLPAAPAIISFDDGYQDNYTVALPLLRRHRMPALFFISTGFLDGGVMFNDRVIEAVRRAGPDPVRFDSPSGGETELLPLGGDADRRRAIERILGAIKHLDPAARMAKVEALEAQVGARPPRDMMMRPEQVKSLHDAGMRIGGHTRTHPILLSLDDAAAEREISGGIDDLAGITGERPHLFAYPNGKRGSDYDARHVGMVGRAGCRFAFSTRPGAAGIREAVESPLELPRFTPWDRSPMRFGGRALANLITARRGAN